MEILVRTRHLEVSEAFREHAADKLNRVEKFDPRLTSVDVEVVREQNPRVADSAIKVELTCRGTGPVVRAEASAGDKFVAFDSAFARLEERLRRAADRRRDHHRGGVARPAGPSGADRRPATSCAGDRSSVPKTTPSRVAGLIDVIGDGPLVVREKEHDAAADDARRRAAPHGARRSRLLPVRRQGVAPAQRRLPAQGVRLRRPAAEGRRLLTRQRRVPGALRSPGTAARRLAIASQGLARPRPNGRRSIRAHLRSVLRSTGLIQIDSVNVLARAHYLPVFSRLGPYDPAVLDRAASRSPRLLMEYWAHEASLVPVEDHPLFRWRMARAADDAWGLMREASRSKPGAARRVMDLVAEHGRSPPATSNALHDDRARRAQGSVVGLVARQGGAPSTCSGTARSPPPGVAASSGSTTCPSGCCRRTCCDAPTPDRADAQAELVLKAARSMGVATATDLRDYYRLPVAETPRRDRQARRRGAAGAGRGGRAGAAGLHAP